MRELHDDTLQELAAVMVILGTANATPDADARQRGIADARAGIGRQIRTLRRLIEQMRPLALDSLGLNAAIEDLGRHAADTSDLAVSVVTQPLPRFADDTETAIYRIIQEALTNAVRHSGARHIVIRTAATADTVELTVTDDGCGPATTDGFPAGHGLAGMRERADVLGADLYIGPANDAGTLVRLRVSPPGQVKERPVPAPTRTVASRIRACSGLTTERNGGRPVSRVGRHQWCKPLPVGHPAKPTACPSHAAAADSIAG